MQTIKKKLQVKKDEGVEEKAWAAKNSLNLCLLVMEKNFDFLEVRILYNNDCVFEDLTSSKPKSLTMLFMGKTM